MTSRERGTSAKQFARQCPLVGRADLLRALAAGLPDNASEVAQALGYHRQPTAGNVTMSTTSLDGSASGAAQVREPLVAPPVRLLGEWPDRSAPTHFIRCLNHSLLSEWSQPPDNTVPEDIVWSNCPKKGASQRVLAPWNRLNPRLRSLLTAWLSGQELDVDGMVEQLAQGDWSRPLPLRPVRRWGTTVQVLVDRSERLMPYFRDQDLVVSQLRRLLGRQQIEVYYGTLPGVGIETNFREIDPSRGEGPRYQRPISRGHVLILGDLGCLESAGRAIAQRWLVLAQQLREVQAVPLALVPCHAGRIDRRLSAFLKVQSAALRRTRLLGEAERDVFVRRLLGCVARLDRVEPGLLREYRLLLDPASEPGLEADAWQHPVFVERASEAGTLGPPDDNEPFVQQFAQESTELRRRVIELLPRWRTTVGPEVYFEELSRLSPQEVAWLPSQDRVEAVGAWRYLVTACEARHADPDDPEVQYARRVITRLTLETRLNPQVGTLATRLEQCLEVSRTKRPPVIPTGEPARFLLHQRGDELVFAPCPANGPVEQRGVGSPLGIIRTRNGWVGIQPQPQTGFERNTHSGIQLSGTNTVRLSVPLANAFTIRTDTEAKVFESLPRSPSATAAGRDRFGLWEETEIVGQQDQRVTIRWRWIPPGTFWMGSPEDEPGRYPDEGPRHLVTISAGFWMAETPCTQEVWTAVMGKNPSRFQGDQQQPVEQVSWNEVQAFSNRVNAGFDQQRIQLPTEAQWEYACRAGSHSALYRLPGVDGGFEIEGNKSPQLEPLAWYWANSGHRTHPVRQKLPNAWGLYDMLGNVWEWCLDPWRKYDAQPFVDQGRHASSGESRVVRGGSWFNLARSVRCAFRSQYPVDYRDFYLGFRLVRVQRS